VHRRRHNPFLPPGGQGCEIGNFHVWRDLYR
jgi:hypothetical protein